MFLVFLLKMTTKFEHFYPTERKRWHVHLILVRLSNHQPLSNQEVIMTTPHKIREKIAKNKYTLLELANKLGNVAAACRQMNYSRSQFYEIKRRFQLEGFQGLIDRPPIPKHPRRKSNPVLNKILELSRQHPAWGQRRIAAQARLEGIAICPATVHNHWKKQGLTTRYHRWLWVEKHHAKHGIILTEVQIKELERLNPCVKERHVESPCPGYLLSQDTFYVGHFKGIGRVYLQAVIDTFCSLGFAKLYTSKQALTAADILNDRVLPFYQEQQIKVQHILTDNGTEYCGRWREHYYQLLLALHDIKHRRTKTACPRTNGFVERFNRTVLDEFFRGILRRKFYHQLPVLQTDLDDWMTYYNTQRPHLGYRNNGRTPMMSFNLYKEQHSKQLQKQVA
jgi:transposase InsO family protein